MRRKVILGLVVAAITMLLVAFSGCGGCGKKATKPTEEEKTTEEETPAGPEVSETPEEVPVTTPETPETPETPASATTPQPPVSKKKNKGQTPKAQSQPQAQLPQVQPPEYEYQVLWEEEREFKTGFTMWGETRVEEGLIIPEDVNTSQEIDITALFTIYTPEYYSPKIQEEGAIVPLPLEGTFTEPDIVKLKLNYDPNTQFYPGEDALEIGIKEKNVTVQTASGSKVIDTSKTKGRDTVYMAFESNWPEQISLPQSQKDVKNIEVLAVIPSQSTQIEIPAKLSISKLPLGTKKNYEVPGIPEDIDVTIKYPSFPSGYPEAEINGKLVIAGEVQK